MKKIYYEKIGRKYVLVMSYPGGKSTRYNINPDYAAMIAAGRVAEDAICRAISKASELRPKSTPITVGQKRAWEKLAKEFGDDLCTLHGSSVHDCAEAGIKAMQEEADKLLSNPIVRKAYEKFLFVAELTKEYNKII